MFSRKISICPPLPGRESRQQRILSVLGVVILEIAHDHPLLPGREFRRAGKSCPPFAPLNVRP